MNEPRYKIGDHLCLLVGGGVGLRVYRVARLVYDPTGATQPRYRLMNMRLLRLDEGWVNEDDLVLDAQRGTDALTSGMACPIVPCLKCANCCAGGA